MKRVYIAGIGQTVVGEHWEKSLANLSAEAILPALKEAGKPTVEALYAGNLFASAASEQANIGAMIASNVGLTGVETFTVEAGEASGAAALRMGYLAIRSGYVHTVLVVGVEKYTDMVGARIESVTAQSMDYDFEGMAGLSPQAQAGLLLARYMDTYAVARDAFGALPIIAHRNAINNPYAMYRRAITTDMYNSAGMVCDPLNLYDAAPYADGAAAILLTDDEKMAKKAGFSLVEVRASSGAVDALALHDRTDLLAFSAVTASTQKAMAFAGLGWDEIDVFELWDAFSIYGILSIEACGLSARGAGWQWIADNADIPVVTMGGNKARGFPVGAAGVYQAAEASMQLRGTAGENQAGDAKTVLIQAMGGPASNVVTHILARV